MIKIKHYLTSNYGKEVHKDDACLILNLPNISERSFLCALYNPLPKKVYHEEQQKLIKLDPTYGEFIKQTNGCRLFFMNLMLYGYQNDKDYYVPLDFEQENYTLSNKGCPYVCIGTTWLKYLIAYRGKDVVIIDNKKFNIVSKYSSFAVFFEKMVKYLNEKTLAKQAYTQKKARPIDYLIDLDDFIKQ